MLESCKPVGALVRETRVPVAGDYFATVVSNFCPQIIKAKLKKKILFSCTLLPLKIKMIKIREIAIHRNGEINHQRELCILYQANPDNC